MIETGMMIATLDGLLRAALLVAVFAFIALLGESMRRSKTLVGESARKFVHAASGTWAALWPAFIDLRSIAVIAAMMAVGAVLLRRFKPFQSVYSIRRLSVGEVLIGGGLAASALFAESGAVFASAVLIIAWSDSAAALVGLKYGKKRSFRVLSSRKSLVGSGAFFASTVVIMMTFLYYQLGSALFDSPAAFLGGLLIAAVVSFGLTIVELTGVYGIDNLTIPLFATIMLNALI